MGLVINVAYDSSVTSQPATFQAQYQAAVDYVVAFYEHAFTNAVTVSVTFAWNPIASGDGANNDFLADSFSYTQIRNALVTSQKSPDDITAYTTLPANNPTGDGNDVAEYELTLPQERALGLGTNTHSPDDLVTLNSNFSWTFDPNNRAVAGAYDAIGVIAHEISEGVFGRIGDLGSGGKYTPLDLYRYASAGVRDLTPGLGFFSIDGTQLLTQFNNPNNGGDAGDWLPSIVGDSFGTAHTGVIGAVNFVDLKTLDVAGWNRAPATTTDFTGDAFSDLLFRDTASGTFTEWASTAGRFTANAYVNAVNTAWNLAGSGDFNGDSVSDVIWRNATDGTFTEWQSTGTGFTQNVYVDGTVSTAYALAAIGDFNGDGKSDLLWRSTSTGLFTEWQSNGNAFTANVYVDGTTSTDWAIAATGDFNGDDKTDLLFRNTSSGLFTEWQSNGNAFTQNAYVDGSVDTGWTLAGTGDFNGDGNTDIVFRNDATGLFTEWQSTGNAFTQNVYVDGSVSTTWTLAAVSDFNGDSKSDLLWRNISTGMFTEWQSTGNGFTPNVYVDGTVANAWILNSSPTHLLS